MKLGYIYVAWTSAFPFACKVGITNTPALRRAAIEAELRPHMILPSKVYFLISVPSFFKKKHEQTIHRWLRRARCSMPKHSGHTEWFWSAPGNLMGFAVWYIITAMSGQKHDLVQSAITAIIVAFFPLPLGVIAAVVLLSIVEIALVVFGIVIAFTLIVSLISFIL